MTAFCGRRLRHRWSYTYIHRAGCDSLTFDVFGRRIVLEDGHFLTLADSKIDGLSSLLLLLLLSVEIQCDGNVGSAIPRRSS
jgi:hypothetical protein